MEWGQFVVHQNNIWQTLSTKVLRGHGPIIDFSVSIANQMQCLGMNAYSARNFPAYFQKSQCCSIAGFFKYTQRIPDFACELHVTQENYVICHGPILFVWVGIFLCLSWINWLTDWLKTVFYLFSINNAQLQHLYISIIVEWIPSDWHTLECCLEVLSQNMARCSQP